MQTEYLITVEEFCVHNHIETSFISSLQQAGLIEITMIDNCAFIEANQLAQLERFVHLYDEVDVNFEAIQTIDYLMQQIVDLQDKIKAFQNNRK